MTRPARPRPATTTAPTTTTRAALRCACEMLEPRRLLAVGLDPTFGGGDGFTLLRSPFDFQDVNGAGVAVTNPIFPYLMSRLGDNYFVVATHNVADAESNATISSETVHALVNPDGTPSTAQEKDTDGDGLAFYGREGFAGNFASDFDYRDLVPLPDGTTLALLRGEDTGQFRVVKVLPNGRQHQFFNIAGIGKIQGIELLTPDLGVLLTTTSVEDPVYSVQLFRTATGALVGDAVRPFGDWLGLDRMFSVPTLHVGRDGAVYVATQTTDLDGPDTNPDDSGFIITRLVRPGQELLIDESFGTEVLPGQTTPAVYMPSSLPALSNVNSFDLIGATNESRLWVKVPDPDTGQAANAFALLTTSGQLDPTFDGDGVVEVDFLQSGIGNLADESPFFPGTRTGLTTQPLPFVRGDGSIVGVVSAPSGFSFPAGTEFGLGVYGVLEDGSFDPRIAEEGSTHGVGRAIVATAIDRLVATPSVPFQAVVYLDPQERLVVASETRQLVSEDKVPLDLMVSRILLGTPRAEIIDRPDGTRVFEVEGTTGSDRLILRAGGGQFQLFSHAAGAAESMIGQFPATGVTLVEARGGEGADAIFSELGNSFGGFVTLFGGVGNDTLSGDGRFTRLFGEDGDDTLTGGVGDQLIFGGLGNDSLLGGSGRDALFGQEGDDVLRGQLDGDYLDGGAGNDTLAGDEDNDTLVGNVGDDSSVGGDGIDLVSYGARAEAVLIRIGSDTNGPIAGFEADFVADDVENALGGAGDDSIVGGDGRNFLLGGAGNDTLLGLDGKDTLLGGAGSDRLEGGDDFDQLLDLDALLATNTPDALFGGEGFDIALIGGDEDDVEDVESVFETLDDLLEALESGVGPVV